MGYAEQNLMLGEEIVYKARLHWSVFLRATWPLIFAIFVLLIGLGQKGEDAIAVQCFSGILFIGAVIFELGAFSTFFTTEFALTNKRIIAKTGLVRRRSVDLLLTKVESIGVRQSILGRILNYGMIIVTGTGGTKEPFGNISDPLELRKRVTIQISGS